MIAQLSPIGENVGVIWMFAVGILVVLFVVALILMGVSLIRTLIR